METRRLEYFAVLAETGNFSRAADRLGISQPALSQQVQRLEDELGAQLFDRSSRPVTLTKVGQHLLALSLDLIDHTRAVERLATEVRGGRRGRLRIGIIPLALYGRIPTVVQEYRTSHADVDVTLQHVTTTALIEMLQVGRFDVAFMTATPPAGSGFDWRDLDGRPLSVTLPALHPLADKPQLTLRELRSERLIMFAREIAAENFDRVVSACSASGFSPEVVTVEGGYAEQVGYVASGAGYALLPEEISCINHEGVVRIPLVEPELELEFRVVWRPDRMHPPLERFLATIIGSSASAVF